MDAASTQPLRYAGFWVRFSAWSIDVTICQLLLLGMGVVLASVAHAQGVDADTMKALVQSGLVDSDTDAQAIADLLAANGVSDSNLFDLNDMLLYLGISFVYHTAFTASRWQATPGKHGCKLQVIMENGMPLTPTMAAVRWFARLFSWVPLGFGFFMAGYTKQKIAMHDAICGTRVVYRPAR